MVLGDKLVSYFVCDENSKTNGAWPATSHKKAGQAGQTYENANLGARCFCLWSSPVSDQDSDQPLENHA